MITKARSFGDVGLCSLALAQNKQVSGTVTDADGMAAIGASVVVDGTTVGTTTNTEDDGIDKAQRHSPEVKQSDLTNLCIDKIQMGLPQHQLPR